MRRKPVKASPAATADADDIADHYATTAQRALADRFADALLAAYQRLSQSPGIGSPLLGERCGIAGLRSWKIKGFPYLVCYFEQPEHIDVWRILHGARDLGALLESELE